MMRPTVKSNPIFVGQSRMHGSQIIPAQSCVVTATSLIEAAEKTEV